jgi:hypothetical protein
MKTAVILRPTTWSFQAIAGLPLIQRTVLSAQRCEFTRIIIVGAQHTEQLHMLLKNDARTCGVEIRDKLPPLEGSAVAVIPSDCVLTTATLARVTAMRIDDRPLLFTSPMMSAIALCRPAMLAGIDLSALADGGAEGVGVALQRQGAPSISLDGEVCVRITDAHSVLRAEKALCQQLHANTAASDGPLAHRIDRHISLRISRWLVRHRRCGRIISPSLARASDCSPRRC